MSLKNITKSNISCDETLIKLKPRPWDFGEITLLILLIFGTIGNTLTIMVMRRKRLRNTNASLFVICIAVCDILLLTIKFFSNMIKMYRVAVYDFCIFLNVVPQAASFISIWLIIFTSAERTVAVISPFKVQSIFSKARCKCIIFLTCLTFMVLSSTMSLCIRHSKSKPHYCEIKGLPNGTCFNYYNYVFPWFKSIFGSWIPSLLGITLNLIIIKELYKAAHSRKNITSQSSLTKRRESFVRIENCNQYEKEKINNNSNFSKNSFISKKSFKAFSNENNLLASSQSKERQITIMLLTISFSFILLTLPYALFELLRKLGVGIKILKSRTFMRVMLMLIDINHATNFLLFCLTAQRFRTELKKIIFPRKKLKFIKKINQNPNKLVLVQSDHCLEKIIEKNNDIESTGIINPVNPENLENFNEIKEKSF